MGNLSEIIKETCTKTEYQTPLVLGQLKTRGVYSDNYHLCLSKWRSRCRNLSQTNAKKSIIELGLATGLKASHYISMFFFKRTESCQIGTLGPMHFYMYPVLLQLFKSICIRFLHSNSCFWASVVFRDYD